MRVFDMRTGISVTVSPADRARLMALIRNRNAPQKHVWRAEIVLLSADGVGTNEIAPDRHVEDLRLALAGTIHGRRLRWAFARQDAALACGAAGSGRRARRGTDP